MMAHMQRGRDAVAPGQALAAGQALVAAPQTRRRKVRRHAHGSPRGRRHRRNRMDAFHWKVGGYHGGAWVSVQGISTPSGVLM